MKGMHYIYLWTLVWALMACTSREDEPQAGEEIRLNATVGEITSRATLTPSPYRGATPTEDNPLKAWVWFSESNSTFSDTETDTETHLPCRTIMEFKGITVDAKNAAGANLKYGSNKDDVYCVGFYPVYKDESAQQKEMVWSTTDGTNVTADIDGTTDLMFASRISGKWGTPMDNQIYKHLQSWVKINICATSQDAVTAWGEITKITVNSQKKVKVDLAAATPVGYDTDGEIVILEKTGEKPIYLQTTMEEVGSVFCSPALSFTVNFTIGGKTVSATIEPTAFEDVTLDSEEDAKGKLFILTFYFNEFKMIEGVCTLNAWEAQNEDLYMKPVNIQTP